MGNLNAQRDWGFAPEYVEVMWKMLQIDKPEDFVVGSGESHSVREFLERAFHYAGVEIEWRGKKNDERGIVKSCADQWKSFLRPGESVMEIDPNYFRPTEVDLLRADISKAKRMLQWEPRFSFWDLIRIMVDYDMLALGLTPPNKGVELLKLQNLHWTMHRFSSHQNIRNETR